MGSTTKQTYLNAVQKTTFSTVQKSKRTKIIFSFALNDSLGQGLLIPIDTVRSLSTIETKNEPVTARYQLKTSRLSDTLAAFRNAYNAVFRVPSQLVLPLEKTPSHAFPHPQAAAYSDSLYPFKIVPIKTDQRLMGVTTFDLALMSRHIV